MIRVLTHIPSGMPMLLYSVSRPNDALWAFTAKLLAFIDFRG
jgi:hypothetical protein